MIKQDGRKGKKEECVICRGRKGLFIVALVAQLGERKTEDLKVGGSSPPGGTFFICQLCREKGIRKGDEQLLEWDGKAI